MPRPVHVEILASDPESSMAFDTALVGWRFTRSGAHGARSVGRVTSA